MLIDGRSFLIQHKVKYKMNFWMQDEGRDEQEGEAGCDFGVAGREDN